MDFGECQMLCGNLKRCNAFSYNNNLQECVMDDDDIQFNSAWSFYAKNHPVKIDEEADLGEEGSVEPTHYLTGKPKYAKVATSPGPSTSEHIAAGQLVPKASAAEVLPNADKVKAAEDKKHQDAAAQKTEEAKRAKMSISPEEKKKMDAVKLKAQAKKAKVIANAKKSESKAAKKKAKKANKKAVKTLDNIAKNQAAAKKKAGPILKKKKAEEKAASKKMKKMEASMQKAHRKAKITMKKVKAKFNKLSTSVSKLETTFKQVPARVIADMNKAEEDSLAKSRKINAQKEAKRNKAIMKTRKANKKADKATSALMKKWGYNLQGKPLKKSAAKGKKS